MSRDRVRNKHNKKSKRVILVAYEGKTEKKYLKSFSGRDKDYNIETVRGNETDPVNLVKQTIRDVKNNSLNLDEDDRAYCLIDTDTDVSKNRQINEAIKLAKNYGIIVVTSSPCIELWFCLHFRYSTRYMDSFTATERLRGHVENYKKGYNIYPEIVDNTKTAIKNAKKLAEFQKSQQKSPQTVECNPHTEVYKIIEEFIS